MSEIKLGAPIHGSYFVNTITVPTETEGAIRRELEDNLTKLGNMRDAVVAMFASRAMLRDETSADRFHHETGYELTPAVLAALRWERGA